MQVDNNSHDKSIIQIFDYNAEDCNQFSIVSGNLKEVEELSNVKDGYIRWINIDDEIDQETLEKINKDFEINHLITEDIRDSNKRAKIEDFEDYLYIIAKMIYYADNELVFEHMNFIMGKNYVISFGAFKGDVFDSLRDRIMKSSSRVRARGSDFLMYAILDTIIDGYFDVLDIITEKIDDLEESILQSTSREELDEIRKIKNDLIYIYKYSWPLREVLSRMEKESSILIRPETDPYIRNIYDHIVQVIETTETHRELLSGLTEIYISNTSNRLNEVMKVLTIISTIFIPLTFISGVYGMNFHYMPELASKWGYPIVLTVMVILVGVMIMFFKRKKWF